MTREDPTGEKTGPGARRRLGTGVPPVVVTVLDRDGASAGTPLDGRVLDTAEVRALTEARLGSIDAASHAGPHPGSRLASGATATASPVPPAQQRDSLDAPERGMDMAAKTTRTNADTVVAPARSAGATATFGDAHFVATSDDAPPALTRARFPRADQDLRERPALVVPGWLAGAALLLAVCGVVWAVAASGHIHSRLPGQVRDSTLLDVSEPVALGAGAAAALVGLLLLLGMFVVQAGSVRVMSRFGRYKGTVRRTGLVWAVPFRRRRKVDTRLRHWRSRPMDLTDRQGTPLQVMVLVVWQVRDTARARFAVRDHEQYLRQQIEAAVSAVTASLPCDSFTRGSASLRDTEHANEEMTRRLSGAMTAAGVQVFSVQALHIDYAPQVAESMLRRRIAALDASTRTAVLDDVVDTVSQAVDQFTRRALVRLDEDGRTDFIRDLTVAMYTARGTAGPAAARD